MRAHYNHLDPFLQAEDAETMLRWQKTSAVSGLMPMKPKMTALVRICRSVSTPLLTTSRTALTARKTKMTCTRPPPAPIISAKPMPMAMR